MQIRVVTAGTAAAAVPSMGGSSLGMRLLCRDGNTGDVYLGTADTVTTSTGVLLPKGDPGVVAPFTVPAEHFIAGKSVYLVASGASQLVDVSAE